MDISHNCSICYNDIPINKLVNTSCNHIFCNTCFFRWMYDNKTCPICRHQMIKDSTREERIELGQLRQLYEWEYEHLQELQTKIEGNENIITELSDNIKTLETQKKNLSDFINRANYSLREREYQRNRNRGRRHGLFLT
jgi:septal ring factor EnvC (AmiA/AmiB activator)